MPRLDGITRRVLRVERYSVGEIDLGINVASRRFVVVIMVMRAAMCMVVIVRVVGTVCAHN